MSERINTDKLIEHLDGKHVLEPDEECPNAWCQRQTRRHEDE